MVTVNIVVTDDAVQPEIYLGRQGEKQAREIVFDLSALREKYGTGTATLYHQRSKDPAPYLIAETTGTTLTWTVSETDTVYAGIGYCEFRYTFGTEGLSKSTMFATNVKASLSGDVIIPAALQAWYDALIDYIDTHSGGGGGGSGLTNDIKDALLQIASKVVYVDGDGQTYYNALYDALYPTVRYSVTNTLSGCATSNDATTAASGSSYSATITANTGYSLTGATVSVTMDGIDITSTAYNNGVISIASVSGNIAITVTAVAITLMGINAAYTQSGTVYDTDTLDSLKTDLVVTAHYSDSSTQTVPAADYTLSGTLAAGTSTITVSYGGKTATFEVTVESSAAPVYALYIPASNTGQLVTTLGRDVTNKITKIVLDCALPVYSALSVIFRNGSKWLGVNNGAWDGALKTSAAPAYSEIAGQGRATVTFEISATGTDYLGVRSWSNNHPEMTIYGFDVYSGDTLQGSFRPTSTVGEMINSVSGSTINWTDATGMTVTEVE